MNKIRNMQSSDTDSVIRVHLDAFQGFFLTFLGPAFLREFYCGVCEDPSGIALVYEDGSVTGFVVGTTQPSGFYRRLLQKRWWKFGLASLNPLIRKPWILSRLSRAIMLPGKSSGTGVNTGTLMSLAVRTDHQGKGIGKQLVTAFLEQSSKKQIELVNLTTDAIANEPTNEFYKRLGFTCARTFSTPEGRVMNEYIVHT